MTEATKSPSLDQPTMRHPKHHRCNTFPGSKALTCEDDKVNGIGFETGLVSARNRGSEQWRVVDLVAAQRVRTGQPDRCLTSSASALAHAPSGVPCSRCAADGSCRAETRRSRAIYLPTFGNQRLVKPGILRVSFLHWSAVESPPVAFSDE